MESNKPRLFPIFLVLALGIMAMAAIIILPGLFVDPASRPGTWNSSIVIACILVALISLYAALPFFPKAQSRTSMAVYPSIAYVLLPYALIMGSTLILASGRTALYASLLTIETIIAFGLAGSLAAIGSSRRKGELDEAQERQNAFRPALEVRSIRDELALVKGKGSDRAFNACAESLRLLEERSASSTRFGRQGAEALESEIVDSIAMLGRNILALRQMELSSFDSGLDSCTTEAKAIIKMLDRRERSLVR